MSTNTTFLTSDQNVIDRVERITQVGHWTLDVDNQKLFWSEQVYKIHGLSPDIYTPEVETGINAYLEEDRDYVTQCLNQAVENGESFIFECRLKHTNGDIRNVIARGECEKNQDGKVIRIFGTFQDITELKLEQERYELAIQASNTAIWDWDTKTDEIQWYGASASVLGFENNDTLPETSEIFFKELLHSDSQEQLKKAFKDHFKDKVPFKIELKFKKNDEYIWMLTSGKAQWDENNRAIRIIGALTDISALKDIEAKLIRSNNDLDQFASIAAHDLQQPLRSISGFLEILYEKHKDDFDEDSKKYIDFAVSGAQNMSELISDLLEYSRLEADGIKYKNESIEKIIQSTISHLQAAIKESGTKITIGPMPNIECDGYKLQRVIYNLTENAIKYRGEKPPEISISCEEKNKEWLFTVKDNGIGIKAEKLESIFLMFTRLHAKEKYAGTGIGLSISKKIIELHGGKIWAESTPQEGSAFHFTIPKAHS